ncbi:hypothetical protein GOFOIKOB_4877 [Methylobacterium tardum]|uniref:Uncharacterized protein n=1 Tax=Methylobacterium tardum TaxID=374432 RepID=A0AA37TIW2_9HYPH|nr:hypothetical protein [Methylobacterium tardum]URD35810.1 hypothetical protein M6G65_25690 [Methylobacterium tardum]GJE51813.1 hypothetical protein GOFOIKOB_4877 [Methylobacterium tardum]GLS72330.1 hypothetical protein GCM10007890_43430 [Methylobacterium tardum]
MHLSFRPYPRVQPRPNFIIGMVGFLLKASADSLARLSVELQDREYLDDTDMAVIEAQLAGVKSTFARIETELAAPGSKVREASPSQDGASVPGGI